MPKHGKRFSTALAAIDRSAAYEARQALELVKANARAKFDETIEANYRLGIDARHADQNVRGTVSLPNGTGKTIRVAVFAAGEKATEAEQAGADIVGGKELAEAIQGGRDLDFDLTIATPDLMSEVGKVGKILGPRGLMPNPKAGTVTFDIAKTVEEFKAGKIEYRNDRAGNVQAVIGKASFELDALFANLAALTDEIVRARPASTKGRFVRNLSVSSTMGPGVRIDVSSIEDLAKAGR
ncbi:MAG: 50S ribosomal protein L1 [Acidimicrobiia bacterium]|nr:50S ribosomal protein L1 [Acidimicrobiia bacterium]NNF09697.1 50S ribosomal protein L1 [Acidimicrobiia bacterium]